MGHFWKAPKFHIQAKYQCSIETLLRDDRAKYMQACLDIICAWVNDGAPKRRKLVMAKYGEWEAIIGGIFDWLIPAELFLSDHVNETLSMDAEKDQTITFLKRLMIEFPRCNRDPVGVSEIAERVFSKEQKSTLRDFVPDGLIGSSGSSFAKRLGRWLKAAATRKWGAVELIPTKDTETTFGNIG